MPIYDYYCNKCGMFHEVLQSSSEHYEDTCPECSGKLSRMFPRANFRIPRRNELTLHADK